MELDSVLEGDVIGTGEDDPIIDDPQVEVEAKVEVEPEAEPEQKDDETTASKKAEVPLAALLDEREKRQEAQRSYAALQEQMSSKKEPTDPFEDFEGAFNEMADGLMQAVNSRFIDLTTDLERSLHNDYEEMESLFLKEAATDPSLIHKMQNSSNPAKFAYNHAKSKSELEEAGDLDALKAKIRAELETEILGEASKDRDTRDSVPNSLSDARASGKSTGRAQAGPTPLDALF